MFNCNKTVIAKPATLAFYRHISTIRIKIDTYTQMHKERHIKAKYTKRRTMLQVSLIQKH